MSQSAAGGIVVAPLGARFGAAFVDRLVPGALVGLWAWLFAGLQLGGWLIYSVAFAIGLLGWVMAQWWLYAVRRAGLGFRLFGLELVGLKDGRPIGWGRMCLRTLISHALWAFVVPGVIMAVFLVVQERRQGWPDLAVGSLAIARRARTPQPAMAPASAIRRGNSTVGLPPHLLSNAFAAQPDYPAPSSPIDHAPIDHTPVGQALIGPAPVSQASPGQGAPGQMPTGQAPTGWGPVGQGQTGQSAWAPPVAPTGQAPAYQRPGEASSYLASPYQQPSPSAPPYQPGPASTQQFQPGSASAQQPYAAYQQSQPPQQGWPYPQPAQPQPYQAVQAYQPPQPMPPGLQPPGQQGAVPPPPQPGNVQPPLRIKPRQAPSDDIDGTRLVAAPGRGTRPATEGWHVRLDDGRDIPVKTLVLIGRNPQPRPTEQDATLVQAGEPARTVSKTHLALGVDSKGMFVLDRGSTNGTALMTSSGALEPCAANAMVRLHEGQVVSFGERQLQVLRYPASSSRS
ncbi:hypothetical protein GCM10009785_07490 [Brooklawnia cerclae]|uniref:FHA domain-containing protein n=1 Tax=Brooklawnia cerclae TaxID=349934 RepID=A0ABX0SNK3_9ACTN|nr:RDD family protein [Brooklawnia cerclae]NIH58327.1 hypothetical protein [Brooklawnia cerclae]